MLAGKFEPTISKRYNKIVYDGENSFCMVGKEVCHFCSTAAKILSLGTGKMFQTMSWT